MKLLPRSFREWLFTRMAISLGITCALNQGAVEVIDKLLQLKHVQRSQAGNELDCLLNSQRHPNLTYW